MIKISALILIVTGVVLGVAFSYVTAVEIQKTESGAFCSSCHTMKPMTIAHSNSVHGGNNRFGVSAQCIDCHLPHDTLANYILHKVKFGVRDAYREFFTDTSDINWSRKRADAKSFVFNSGCLSCHTSLDHSSMKTLAPDVVKRADDRTLKTSCLECHPHVGHKWVSGAID